jgi:hypothetical protein
MERDSLAENTGLISFPNTGGGCVSTFTWTIKLIIGPVHHGIIPQAHRLRRDIFSISHLIFSIGKQVKTSLPNLNDSKDWSLFYETLELRGKQAPINSAKHISDHWRQKH